MIRIAEGYEQLWPGFGLRISSDLVFEEGGIYQLKGPNGSGKSSFISKILIPALSREDIWLLHFEHQNAIHKQQTERERCDQLELFPGFTPAQLH